MKRYIMYSILTFCLINYAAFAKDTKLKILSANRSVSIKSSTGTVSSLKSGASVNYSDIIIVNDKGYLVVQCENGKPLELKTAGEYSCKTLSDNCTKITSAGFKDFADWMATNMIKQKSDKGSMMKNLGAVSRMSSGSKKVSVPIALSKIMDSNVTLIWHSLKMKLGSPNGLGKEEKQAYIVKIFDNKGDQIHTQESNDTTCTVDLKTALSDTVTYYWQVEAKGYPRTTSNVAALIFTGVEEKQQICEKEKTLNNEFESTDSPFVHFLLANYYDSNGYYLDAYLHYKKSLSIPDPPEEYIARFNEFIESQTKSSE